MNIIENYRIELQKKIEASEIETEEELFPDDDSYKFKIIKKSYKNNMSMITIINADSSIIANCYLDDDRFFHSWITKNNHQYLMFAENLCGGISIVDLERKIFVGFMDGSDGFICTKYVLSPDENTLAIEGCYWACPYEIKLFHIKDLMSLPYDEIGKIDLRENNEVIVNWKNNKEIILGMQDIMTNTIDSERVYNIESGHPTTAST